jgi:hypothetical protein
MKGTKILIPEILPGVSDESYLQTVVDVPGFRVLGCNDFKPTKEDLKVASVESHLKTVWNNMEIQEIITPRFIGLVRDITGERVIKEDGLINDDFTAEKFYHFEETYHTHFLILIAKIDSKGIRYLEVRFLDDETRTFDNLVDNNPGYILNNNGYRYIGFDYYPEYSILYDSIPVAKKTLFSIFRKEEKRPIEINDNKPMLVNFIGNTEIANVLSRLSAYPEGYDPLNVFISNRFFKDLVSVSSFSKSQIEIPNQRAHSVAMRALRLNGILGANI